jgi:hypothetical protein
MVQIGDYVQCPKCHQIARVVWPSQDEKLAGIQCPRLQSQIIRGPLKFGSDARPQAKLKKNGFPYGYSKPISCFSK